MRNRSVIMLIVWTFVTLGFYPLYWMVSTKNEMNRVGAQIPTAWLLIVPIVSIFWFWKYSEGVGVVTRGKLSGPVAFLLLFLLSIIGMAIVQSQFNQVQAEGGAQLPQARVA